MRLAVVVVGLAACGDASSGPVTGTATVRYLTPAGELTQPDDLSGKLFTAFGFDGSYPGYGPVAGGSDGTFAIPDVPEGPFVLRIVGADGNARWEQHDDHEVAWTTTAIGNPGGVAPTLTTPVMLEVGAMTAWATGDQLYADCFDNGTENAHLATELFPFLAPNDPAISSSFDWNGLETRGFNLAREPALMTANDSLVISHLAFSTAPPSQSLAVLTELATIHGVAQTDGETATAIGTFLPVARTSTVSLAIDLDAFSRVMAVQRDGGWSVAIVASPGGADELPIGPPLVMYFAVQAGFAVQSSGPVDYGNPFDPGWPVAVLTSYFQFHDVAIPGTDPIFDGLADEMHERVPVGSDYLAIPHAVLPTSVTLDNEPVTTHSIEWDGRSAHVLHVDLPDGVSRFTATAYRLVNLGGTTFKRNAITIESTGTEVRLPAEAFEAGELYALTIATQTGNSGATAVVGPFQIGHAL